MTNVSPSGRWYWPTTSVTSAMAMAVFRGRLTTTCVVVTCHSFEVAQRNTASHTQKSREPLRSTR